MRKRHFNRHRPLFSNILPPHVRSPKIRWKILPVIWRALRRMSMFVGAIVLLNLFLVGIASMMISSAKETAFSVPHESILFLRLQDGFSEVPTVSGFSDPFAPPAPTLRQLVDSLDHAAQDNRIKGLIARMEDGDFALSHSYELRAAIKRFRAAGKFAYIYSSSYGEGGGGLGRYYLASAFDQIWMQPLGMIAITGVSAEIPFAKETLQKIGLTPQFFQRREYKSAFESVTSDQISSANKEAMTALVADIRKEFLREVPAERKISAAQFEVLINKGLIMADEAVKAKLIDRADYGDVLLEEVAKKVYGKADADLINFVDIDVYINQAHPAISSMALRKSKVALVYASGAIMPSGAEGGGFGGEHIAAADEIAPVLHEISKDESIEAVIVRVDSPGGSPTASESILRGIEKVRAAGKPVIVSMGSAAASGGYWIASSADRIFAAPTTLTGSIGVVGGKMVIDGLSDKIGVNWERIEWGQNAGIWSMSKPFTASESERMNAMLDHVYEAFKDRVAKGRKMDSKEVEKIAKGRVWSGKRALEVGLVDEIGGLTEAQEYTAKLLKHKNRKDLEIVVLPKPKTTFEMLLESFGQSVSSGFFGLNIQEQFKAHIQPLLRMMDMSINPSNYTVYNSITADRL